MSKAKRLEGAANPFARLADDLPIVHDVPNVTSKQIAGKAPGQGQNGATLTPSQGHDEAKTKVKPHAVNIRLPSQTWSRIEAVVERRGTGQSLNGAVAEAVADWLAKHNG